MASKRMLPDTVTLFNYIGEENMVAKYSTTVLYNVRFIEHYKKTTNQIGSSPTDVAKLFVFDTKVNAESLTGSPKAFMPYSEWQKCGNDEKSSYWTFREDNKDFIVSGICDCITPEEAENAFSVSSAVYLKVGTARMWHWEIDGT